MKIDEFGSEMSTFLSISMIKKDKIPDQNCSRGITLILTSKFAASVIQRKEINIYKYVCILLMIKHWTYITLD